MVARKYFPGFKCLDCGLDWADRKYNFNDDRCSTCYQRRYRQVKYKHMPRKPYTKAAPTEEGYKARILKIAEMVDEPLRQQFVDTYLVKHNPYRNKAGGM